MSQIEELEARMKNRENMRDSVLYYFNSLSYEDQESLLGIVEVYSKRYLYNEARRRHTKRRANHTSINGE
jgi:hypothetical protein